MKGHQSNSMVFLKIWFQIIPFVMHFNQGWKKVNKHLAPPNLSYPARIVPTRVKGQGNILLASIPNLYMYIYIYIYIYVYI